MPDIATKLTNLERISVSSVDFIAMLMFIEHSVDVKKIRIVFIIKFNETNSSKWTSATKRIEQAARKQ